MKRLYEEPVLDIITLESNSSIAARNSDSGVDLLAEIISGFEGDIPIDGDVMD